MWYSYFQNALNISQFYLNITSNVLVKRDLHSNVHSSCTDKGKIKDLKSVKFVTFHV